jgi:aminopeptidase N
VDADKVLLCEKTEHKTLDNYIFQYKNAGLYLDRREAIDFAARKQSDDHNALDFLKTALKDKYHGLRAYTLQKLFTQNDSVKKSVEPLLANIAEHDPNTIVRARAIEVLGRYKKEAYKPIFLKSINDSSYSISGSALAALGAIDTLTALNMARSLSRQQVKGQLADAVTNVLFTYPDENDFDSLGVRFENIPFGNEKFMVLQPFANFLKRIKNPANFMKGIDMIVSFRDTIPEQYRPFLNAMILNGIATSKQSKGMTEQADYVKSKLPGNQKTPESTTVPSETLKKYTGEYDFSGTVYQVVLKDNKSLFLTISGQPEMELSVIEGAKFGIKYMEGYSIEFTSGDKGEVTGFILSSPGGEMKATKKK